MTVPVRRGGKPAGEVVWGWCQGSGNRPADLFGTYSLLTLSPPSPGAFSDQRLELNTFLAFLMEGLELEANCKQTFGTLDWRRPSKQISSHARLISMPFAAALAKHFWKLTGLSDGMWEEGKISPKAPRACLC